MDNCRCKFFFFLATKIKVEKFDFFNMVKHFLSIFQVLFCLGCMARKNKIWGEILRTSLVFLGNKESQNRILEVDDTFNLTKFVLWEKWISFFFFFFCTQSLTTLVMLLVEYNKILSSETVFWLDKGNDRLKVQCLIKNKKNKKNFLKSDDGGLKIHMMTSYLLLMIDYWWKINLIWSQSLRLSWSACEFFNWPL